MSGPGRQRMSTVRRVREVLERRSLGRLAAGRQRVAEAERRLSDATGAYERRRQLPASSSEELRAARLAGLGAHESVRTAAQDVEAADHRREELEREWSEASARRKSAERLEERRAATAATAAERAAARDLDELVAQRRAAR